MLNLNSKLLGGAAVALLAAMFSAPAQAAPTSALYTGGGTLAEKVYRDVMNCYGATSNGADGGTTANLVGAPTGCNAVASYNSAVELLYVGVGSGNGKSALVHHDASKFITTSAPDNPPVPSTTDFGPFYGTGTGTGWVKAASGPFFPNVSFIGSDDPVNTGDLGTYNAAAWGPLNQVPALITTITVPFNPPSGYNPHGVNVSGSSSHTNLTTDTLCGIFTGVITDWSDAAFKGANGGQTLGSGPILVVYRSNSSGSTFLFVNALINQCASTAHPVPTSWQTAVNGASSNSLGVSNNSWFINVNGAGLLPANFTGASGSGGVQGFVIANTGAIGYVSPDFVKPVDATGPVTANLQTWASVLTGIPKFEAPTAKNGTAIVGAAHPPSNKKLSCPVGTASGQSPDGICQDNPLNWGLTFPTPTGTSAYPIGGFTFIDTYSCYASATDVTNIAGTTAGSLGYLRWYFGSNTDNSTHVSTQLTANGFSLIPGSWISAVKALLTTNKPTKIEKAGNTGKCSTASGA